MKVKVFMASAGHNSEREVLRDMHDGIASVLVPEDKKEQKVIKSMNKAIGRGFGVEYEYAEKYINCDLAVFLGSWKPSRSNIHHVTRTSIVENAKSFICIETPLLTRKVFKPNEYYRVGVNGFLHGDAYFGPEENFTGKRFQDMGLTYSGWKSKTGDKIIIALQLAGDASLRNNDINQWCLDTIKRLRKFTDRAIEIRTHPGVSEKGWSNHEELFRQLAFMGLNNVKCVNGREVPWQDHLNDAYCVISYTSGLSIDAIIQGIPVIACDEGNFAWSLMNNRVNDIEKLKLPNETDVQQWLYNLAYCQWTPEEMRSGECFRHLQSSVEQVLQDHEENSN